MNVANIPYQTRLGLATPITDMVSIGGDSHPGEELTTAPVRSILRLLTGEGLSIKRGS
jgi:hypothetical protein